MGRTNEGLLIYFIQSENSIFLIILTLLNLAVAGKISCGSFNFLNFLAVKKSKLESG